MSSPNNKAMPTPNDEAMSSPNDKAMPTPNDEAMSTPNDEAMSTPNHKDWGEGCSTSREQNWGTDEEQEWDTHAEPDCDTYGDQDWGTDEEQDWDTPSTLSDVAWSAPNDAAIGSTLNDQAIGVLGSIKRALRKHMEKHMELCNAKSAVHEAELKEWRAELKEWRAREQATYDFNVIKAENRALMEQQEELTRQLDEVNSEINNAREKEEAANRDAEYFKKKAIESGELCNIMKSKQRNDHRRLRDCDQKLRSAEKKIGEAEKSRWETEKKLKEMEEKLRVIGTEKNHEDFYHGNVSSNPSGGVLLPYADSLPNRPPRRLGDGLSENLDRLMRQ